MTEVILDTVLSDAGGAEREARRRAKDYEFTAVASERADELIAQGWEVDRKLKKRVRLKKLKSIDERLENRFWMLLYRMGYPELNEGRKFTIKFKRSGNESGTKQIDVFVKDDQTAVVAECKASKDAGSLQRPGPPFWSAWRAGAEANSTRTNAVERRLRYLSVVPVLQPDVGGRLGQSLARCIRYFPCERLPDLGPSTGPSSRQGNTAKRP